MSTFMRDCRGPVTLAILAFLPAFAAAQPGDAPLDFYGVSPGITTEQTLLADSRWGAPLSRRAEPSGTVVLRYRIGLWDPIEVAIQDGKVMSIDAVPPSAAEAGKLAGALQLGQLIASDSLPPEARLGMAPAPGWKLLMSSAGRAMLFVDGEKQQVRRIRFYPRPRDAREVTATPPHPREEMGPFTAGLKPQTRQLTRAVARLLNENQFTSHPLDSALARRALHGFLRQVDPHKMYLRRADVEYFEGQFAMAAERLPAVATELVGEIASRQRQRAAECRRDIESWIQAEHDFSIEESLSLDPNQYDFAQNLEESRERWRKRIKYDLLVRKVAGQDLNAARDQVRTRWLGATPGQPRDNPDALVHAFVSAFVGAHDRHSTYLTNEAHEDQRIGLQGQLLGVGLTLALVDGRVVVRAVLPDSPAGRWGQPRIGDGIVAVAEGESGEFVETSGLELSEVVRLIRGPTSTRVRLKVATAGKDVTREVTLPREAIMVSRTRACVLDASILSHEMSGKIGFVHMPTFYGGMKSTPLDAPSSASDPASTSQDLLVILDDFRSQRVDVVVLDLRDNHGGMLSESINVSSLFVGSGPVVQCRAADGTMSVQRATSSSTPWTGPLVVLTSRQTGGGAEILAAAIQDYGRGLVIGDSQTSGAGSVRSFVDIGQKLFSSPQPPRMGFLLLTTHQLFGPSGRAIEGEGVRADIALPAPIDPTMPAIAENGWDAESTRSIAPIAPIPFHRYTALLDDERRQALVDRSLGRRRQDAWFQQHARDSQTTSAPPSWSHSTLHEASLRARHQASSHAPQWPRLPGIPEVALDAYLREALCITMDFAVASRGESPHAP